MVYDYQSKGIRSFMSAAPSPGENYGIPRAFEVKPSVDGTGLELSGWFATWDVDSEDEAFIPQAFDKSLPAAMKLGVPVLYHHNKNEAPIGLVTSAEIRPEGLFGTVVLPKPEVSTKAFDIYAAVKSGKIPLAFSVGGLWQRLNIGGKVKLICERLLELSITPVATNGFAKPTAIASVVGVKGLDVASPNERIAGMIAHGVRAKREAELHRALAKLDVAALQLTARRLRPPVTF